MGILNFFQFNKSQPVQQASIPEKATKAVNAAAPANEVKAMDTATFLQSDDKEWIRYLGQALRTYRKPGVTLKEEHDTWLAARVRSRASVNVADARTARS